MLVRNQIFSRESVRIVGDGPVKIPAGGIGKVLLSGAPGGFLDRVHLELNDPPEGIRIEKVGMNRGQAEITLTNTSTMPKGTKGNLIVNVFTSRTPAAIAKNPKAQIKRMAVGTLPAIPFEITDP